MQLVTSSLRRAAERSAAPTGTSLPLSRTPLAREGLPLTGGKGGRGRRRQRRRRRSVRRAMERQRAHEAEDARGRQQCNRPRTRARRAAARLAFARRRPRREFRSGPKILGTQSRFQARLKQARGAWQRLPSTEQWGARAEWSRSSFPPPRRSRDHQVLKKSENCGGGVDGGGLRRRAEMRRVEKMPQPPALAAGSCGARFTQRGR